MSTVHHSNLPDFIIIGAQKCGTSALRFNLNSHPGISIVESELHYFNLPRNFKQGLEWYSQYFQKPDLLQGEKTPNYLGHPLVAERMSKTLPKAKLIILLRDPVNRAYSHWNHMMQKIEQTSRRGWALVSFEEAIDLAQGDSKPFDRLLKFGEYVDQIMEFRQYFPADQMYIGIQERISRNGKEELAKIFDFLDVEKLPIEPEQVHVREYESPISPNMAKRLATHYEPFNQRLYDFLGETIPEWQHGKHS